MKSAPGKETSLQVALPEKKMADSEHNPEKFASLRIMLAEDDPTNQFAVRKMLEIAGHEVFVVRNGQEAVTVLKENEKRIDGVLMDIQMPVMGGIEAAQVIRHSLKDKDIPIIALTAHAMPGDREEFLQAGMNDYLSKPVEFEDLKKVIAKHIG